MVRFFFFMLASIAALLPSIAHGERRELITGVEVGLTVLHLDEPLRGAGATNSVGGEASAHAYWGLSNVFHVGASVKHDPASRTGQATRGKSASRLVDTEGSAAEAR